MSYDTAQQHQKQKEQQAHERAQFLLTELRALLLRTPQGAGQWPLTKAQQFKTAHAAASRVASRAKASAADIGDAITLLRQFHPAKDHQ